MARRPPLWQTFHQSGPPCRRAPARSEDKTLSDVPQPDTPDQPDDMEGDEPVQVDDDDAGVEDADEDDSA